MTITILVELQLLTHSLILKAGCFAGCKASLLRQSTPRVSIKLTM